MPDVGSQHDEYSQIFALTFRLRLATIAPPYGPHLRAMGVALAGA